MGLDITVYEGPLTSWVPSRSDDEKYDEAYEADAFFVANYNGFDRHAPLKVGAAYKATSVYHFLAGSYSGYGEYRRALSALALDVEPETVWSNPSEFEDKPFFEQINFSDNEDTIGTYACVNLAKDYDDYRNKVIETHDPGSWFFDKYETWREAFHKAADTGGALDLH